MKEIQRNEESESVGPMLPLAATATSEGLNYGGSLLPGEGEAIARFVQQNKRIPRRGEVGISSNEIERFEGAGYVMSGDRYYLYFLHLYIFFISSQSFTTFRHKRMNAVRMRKEAQVYTATEMRALQIVNMEERARRENQTMARLRQMLDDKLKENVKDSKE